MVPVVRTPHGRFWRSRVRSASSGGQTVIGRLRAGESRDCAIHVAGESELRLAFVDSRGSRHDEKIDVYLETGDGGRVTITVQPDLKAAWKHRLWPWSRTVGGVTKS